MKRLTGIISLAALIASAFTTIATATTMPRERKIAVVVTSNGFEPSTINVRAGQPLRLVITREVDRTCATDIVIEDYGIKKALPLNKPVEVRFTPKKTGTIRYACAMGMIAGSLIVK
jgi:plastocyanin domain-containing protein